jgi:hypothetical protein
MMIFQPGNLVIYDDPEHGESICVVLDHGCCGYGNDTRVIYVVHSLQFSALWIVYQSEIRHLEVESQIQVT